MKNVRKLSATVILTFVLGCSAFAGDISGGIISPTPGDISGGVVSPTPGDISGGIVSPAPGDISGGFAEFFNFLGGILLP